MGGNELPGARGMSFIQVSRWQISLVKNIGFVAPAFNFAVYSFGVVDQAIKFFHVTQIFFISVIGKIGSMFE